jgi:mono/diheme cytochrome c family protein
MRTLQKQSILSLLLIFVWAAALPRLQALSAQTAPRGQRIFSQNCASCHNVHNSTSLAGPSLKGYRLRSQNNSDRMLRSLIAHGKGKMPAFPNLNSSQVSDLITYLKTL